MATRRERVILDLEDHFTAGMARAAAATKLLDQSLDSLSGSAVQSARTNNDVAASTEKVSKSADKSSKDVDRLGKNSERTGSQIDKLSGRMRLFAEAAAILGPGLVPITASAVPLLAGLTTQMALAGAAAGVTVLAFKGVGEALKSLNEYQLDPSSKNLEKLQESMRSLGPEARKFVRYLQDIRPAMAGLRKAAQEGLLPGAREGLEELMQLMPRLDRMIRTVADTVGDLMADAGKSLNGPEWRAFFNYLDNDARTILTQMGRTVGNLTQGLASMLVAFAPLTRDFSAGLDRMARSFAGWAAGLQGSDGMGDFIAYVREAGPQVLDLLGSLTMMLVNVGRAAAPLGGPVLASLTAVADAISAIARSDLGTPIFAALAAMALLNRAVATWGAISATSSAKFITGMLASRTAATGTATAMTGMQRAAAAAAGALAAIGIADILQGGGTKALPTVNELANTLRSIGSDPGVARVPRQFDDISKAIERIGDPNKAQALQDSLAGIIGFGGGDDVKNYRNEIQLLDQSLASMVSSNGVGAAKQALKDFADAQGLTKGQVSALVKLLPSYRDAIAGSTGAVNDGTSAHVRYTEAVEESVNAMRTKRSEALAALNAEIGYQAAIDDARKSLKENGKTLDITTAKGRANKTALLNMAAAWNQQSDAAKNTPGAHRAAIRSFVNVATSMGMSETAARRLARRILEMPSKRVKVAVDLYGMAGLNALRASLGSLRDRTVNVRTVYSGVKPGVQFASGGYVTGPGTTTSDSIPALLSNKEYVIKAAAVERYGVDFMHRLNAMRFAGGGSPSAPAAAAASAAGGYDPAISRELAALRREISTLGERVQTGATIGTATGMTSLGRQSAARRKAGQL